MNGDLEELELSEADKLLNQQLLEEAKKASAASKHRGRRSLKATSGWWDRMLEAKAFNTPLIDDRVVKSLFLLRQFMVAKAGWSGVSITFWICCKLLVTQFHDTSILMGDGRL